MAVFGCSIWVFGSIAQESSDSDGYSQRQEGVMQRIVGS